MFVQSFHVDSLVWKLSFKTSGVSFCISMDYTNLFLEADLLCFSLLLLVPRKWEVKHKEFQYFNEDLQKEFLC